VLSSYEFFDKTLKEKSDEMMHRISAPLTPALFKQNITYAINNGPSKTNNIPQIVKIGTQNDLAQDNIEYENIVYDYDYKLFYVPPGPSLGYVKMTTPRLKRRGFSIDLKRKNLYPRSKDRGLTLRSINTSDIKNNHYLKLSYRIAKQANKLRVSYNDKDGTEVVIFEHIPEAYAESQDLIDIYLDVSDAINKSSHVKVVLERNVGPAAFEVGFRSIELY